MVRQGSRLRDLIPIVLNRAAPKASNHCLVCGAGGAVSDTERLDFIEAIAIGIAGQGRRQPRTELVGAIGMGKGSALPRRGKRWPQAVKRIAEVKR